MRQERVWSRQLSAPEAEAGVIDPALLAAVSGLRRDRKAFRRLVHSRRRSRRLLDAAADLARELARAQGLETTEVVHARAELLRCAGSFASAR